MLFTGFGTKGHLYLGGTYAKVFSVIAAQGGTQAVGRGCPALLQAPSRHETSRDSGLT